MPVKLQKTTVARKDPRQQSWLLIDARDQILGRLAAKIAMILMGKHRPQYTPHVDTGDYVIVTNCRKIRLTGKKPQTKQYDHYTYHMGGRKVVSFEKMMQQKPQEVIRQAVRRMLPKNKMGRRQLSKLKIYPGSDHPHAAQQPRIYPLTPNPKV
ncbi:MAG: 50S ribosomal protein L13 [Phycisphaerae bacterium SM23_30]|nr:MAG: 50S ribosomal protein L13 [Phycisphaerae bacterium SM23_30]